MISPQRLGARVLCACLLPLLLAVSLPAQDELKPGPAEPLPALLHTFNVHFLMETAFDGINYGGPQLEKALRATKPHGLRFLGGTLANNYQWKADNFSDPAANDLTGWAGEQLRLFRNSGAAYGLPGFARICQREGLEPIWVLNVYEETPESVVAMMRHLDSLSLKVRHIEMANEPYWDQRTANNVRAYIEYCRPLALALKKHDPALRIGA